jgi:predicted RNA-binding Zn ribbon-like protein
MSDAGGAAVKGTATVPQLAPGEAESVALALVNAAPGGPGDDEGPLSGPEGAAGWLAGRDLGPVPAAGIGLDGVAALADLRAAIRALFTATADRDEPDPAVVGQVNAVAGLAPGVLVLEWSDGWQQRWAAADPGTLGHALALIARDAIEVVCGPNGGLLHRCEAHGCERLFFRTHGRRRWCSNACGDRVRVARHYRLRKARRSPAAS